MNEGEIMSGARGRAEKLKVSYENWAEVQRISSRLSLLGSYAGYIAGVATVATEPLSVHSGITTAVFVGGGVAFHRLKNELRFREKTNRLQADIQQNFINDLDQRSIDSSQSRSEEVLED